MPEISHLGGWGRLVNLRPACDTEQVILKRKRKAYLFHDLKMNFVDNASDGNVVNIY
jgi:hypothetical protein